jgi:hypothetical protein
MKARELRIDMQAIVEARRRPPEDASEAYLDLSTGEVLWSVAEAITGEPDEMEALLANEPGRFASIEREDGREGWRLMQDFASQVDEDDLRGDLLRAIEGKGAFGRFRSIIGRYPDLRERWEAAEWAAHADEVEIWLQGLGFRAVYDPRPSRDPEQPIEKGGGPGVGFLDLLLLGAPEGKTELLNGRVLRQIVVPDESRARAVFKVIARQMAEFHGLAWRNRFIEGKSVYEVDRYHLAVSQNRIELEVTVDPKLWRAFG